jgi:putative ABC transport system permease protein
VSLDIEAMEYRADAPPVLDLERGYRTIVGVVADVRSLALDDEPRAELYTPASGAAARMLTLVYRAPGGAAAERLLTAVSAADVAQPVGRIVRVSQVVQASVAAPTSRTVVLGAFAATTLLLAAVGIYGMVGFSVSRRRKDLGVRLALGASPREVRRQVLGEALVPVLVAVVPGLLGGWTGARALRGVLYQTAPLDPWTFTFVQLFLVGVAGVAGLGPARRAAATDPADVLRSE